MNCIIIAGFLGSGKTTLLLPLARRLVEKGQTLAIIENEVGKVGIDGDYLNSTGLTVRELISGCICCQMRYDLVTTLLDIENTLNPDIVIMEPSGVASPLQVIQALGGYGGNLEKRITVTIVDAFRFHAIKDFGIPLITDGIEVADLVVVNKVDRLARNDLVILEARLRALKPSVNLIPVCAQEGTNLDILFTSIDDLLIKPKVESAPTEVQASNAPVPTVCARKIVLNFSPPIDSTKLIERTKCQLLRLAENLKADGCGLIGHIKAIIKPRHGGYLLVNLTDLSEPPKHRGAIPATIDNADLTLNAIVYGLDSIALYERADSFLQSLSI